MKILPAGIYTAVPTFFHDNEDLDIVSFKKHIQCELSNDEVRLQTFGSCTYEQNLTPASDVATKRTIPVVAGTMGEAVHLVRLLLLPVSVTC